MDFYDIAVKLRNRTIKILLACIFGQLLLLSFAYRPGTAETQHQTIPTMPPTSTVTQFIALTDTPTTPAQLTAVITQPRIATATQTVSGSPTAPAGTATSLPGAEPSATRIINREITPILVLTYSVTLTPQVSLTAPSATTEAPGSVASLYSLLGGGILLIFVIGIVWFLKSKRK